MKLIDKDALIAAIERLKSIQLSIFSKGETKESCCDSLTCISVYNEILSFLDTLEVKEVDLETSIDDYINSHFTEGCDGGMNSDWYKVIGGVHYKDLKDIAKHFFELGLKAQKGE